jgi:C-terminal processing protease CtpA/Prc
MSIHKSLNPFRLILAIAGIVVFSAAGLAQTGPQNLNFEAGDAQGLPQGWKSSPGYTLKLSREQAKEGAYCAELARGNGQGLGFGHLMQSFDAGAYRGKRIRFRAAVRAEALGMAGQAYLWLRVDRSGGQMGFFDNMNDRPIRERDWRYYEITGDVDSDAERVNIGLILRGYGKAWIDDASFEVLGDTPTPEPARFLTARGLQNEVAFARLYGVVRYFHPSDQASEMEWNEFVNKGVREVEGATSDAQLAQKLGALFTAVAPTVRVLNGGQKYSLPVELLPPKDATEMKITYWRHTGLGGKGPAQSVYHSERVQERVASAGGEKVPVPGYPLKSSLSSGVTAWIPLALYIDSMGTLPHLTPDPAKSTAGAIPSLSANDRATRLADVIIAWNVFEHFYPYFDVVGTDWSAVLPRMLERAAADKDESAFNETLNRMIAELHDGHAQFPKGAFAATLPLEWDWIEDKLVITAVGDSIKGKVAPGDAVLKIDGRPAAEALRATEALISGATPQWIRFRALQRLTSGKTDQVARLTIEPFGRAGAAVELSIQYQVLPAPVMEHRPSKIDEIEPGIYYVDIERISDADFNSALPQLKTAHGIIFDFRGYPMLGPAFLTHLTEQKMTSAQWNFPQLLWPDRQNMQFKREGEWSLQPATPTLTAKKAFITDGRAISYAESCMGIVEYYKLGAIVGGPTAGTNGNVNMLTLPGGYIITWTGMKVLKHDGSRHHGVGINPTIPVSRTRAGVAAGRDELLERAITAVKD